MDISKGQGKKLTRNQSSLSPLRSFPTVRSSIHSLASVAEEDLVKPQHGKEKEILLLSSEEKIKRNRSGSTSRRTGLARFAPVLTMLSLTFLILLSLTFIFFFYLKREEIPTSENLLLALIFIALSLFFACKKKKLIDQNLTLIKQLWEENGTRFKLRISSKRSKSNPQVQWFIGETNIDKINKEKRMKREGVEFYSNRDFYEGGFHEGKCNGSGVYNYFSSGRYEGDWVDGRYDGYGIESWAGGSRYKGQYRQGLRHGFGVYKFYTGDSYAGEWFNGQSHGVGFQTCSDGSCYIGEFKYGVKHGLGVYHFRNGDRYAGEYFGDKIHGFGVYYFANGHCYEGSWHEGQKQGYGVYTFRNSEAKCGQWDVGILKTPLPPLTDAVLRAVQSARKTAENAIYLRGVGDQVNKTVQAANRAATAARVAAIKAVRNQTNGRFCDTNV